MKKDENKVLDENFAPDNVSDMIGHTIEELISMAGRMEDVHALLQNGDLEALSGDFDGEFPAERNEICDLVKNSYRLPLVDSPEKMLVSDGKRKETSRNEAEFDPYRMVNLVSRSFRLPEFDEENFRRE